LSRSKAKGTAAETAVVAALQNLGWPTAERRALSGNLDKGDISGIPGVCFEVKDARTWQTSGWMLETEIERVNAGADYGILVIKLPRVGYPNADKWLTVMENDAAFRLLRGNRFFLPHLRLVTMKAVGIHKGVDELVERERHCGSTPVMVKVKRHGTDGYYNLMRLDARCRLLADAGYGGYGIMDANTTSTMKEHPDGNRSIRT